MNINVEYLRNSNILISGGTGFLGSNFINMLEKLNSKYFLNIHIYSLSRHDRESNEFVTYIKHDVTKTLDIFNIDIDYVIHLASNTHPDAYEKDPVGTILTNIIGCDNLLKYCIKKRAKKFILASSVEVYGNGMTSSISEDNFGVININNYRSGYNESKRTCESLCHSYKKQYGVDFSIARFARIFGYDTKKDSKVLSYMIECAVNHKDIILNSTGNQIFSYCYIDDAVQGLLTVLINGKSGECYNISGLEENLSLNDIGKIIEKECNVNLFHNISNQESASKATYAVLNISKASSIGYKPKWSIKDGIIKTIADYSILRRNKK